MSTGWVIGVTARSPPPVIGGAAATTPVRRAIAPADAVLGVPVTQTLPFVSGATSSGDSAAPSG